MVQFGCAGPRTVGAFATPPEVLESKNRFRKEYVLAPGDALDVVVIGNADVSRSCIIRPDGYLSLPLLDDVKAEGLTVSELDAALTSAFSGRLRDPEVSVIATSTREPMVYVFGQVGAPKPVPLRDARTAAQAISYAGDMTLRADTKALALIRLEQDGYLRSYEIPPPAEGQPAPYIALQSILLQPDDLIVVPESGGSQFVRFVTDYINTPLSGITSALNPYFQFKLIEVIEEDN